MKNFFENIKNKTVRAIEEPDLIVPFFENQIKKKITEPYIEKVLNKHEAEFVARGTSKEVYKIPFTFLDGVEEDYVVAFIRKPITFKENTNIYIDKMRKTNKWYREMFGNDFINDEKLLISQNNKDIIIYIQPWIDFDKNKKDLFYDIPENIDLILEEMKENDVFEKQLKEISEKIIKIYELSGILPDLFNSMSGMDHNPANLYMTKNNKIVFIDTHMISQDTRINSTINNDDKIVSKMVSQRRFDYIDRPVDSFNKILEFE